MPQQGPPRASHPGLSVRERHVSTAPRPFADDLLPMAQWEVVRVGLGIAPAGNTRGVELKAGIRRLRRLLDDACAEWRMTSQPQAQGTSARSQTPARP